MSKADKARGELRAHHFAHIHPEITEEAVYEAVMRRMTTLDNPGYCLVCGAEAGGVDPDTRQAQCESCGAPAVYGADEILMEIAA